VKRAGEPVGAWKQQAGAWVVDYAVAREQAIKWLGDRYLLARPINRLQRTGFEPEPAAGVRTLPST